MAHAGSDDERAAGEEAHHSGKPWEAAREKLISSADHSLGNYDLIEDMQSMNPEEINEIPHMLKSFHTWMEAGPAKKSAKGYTEALKKLIVSHRKKLSAMQEDKYFVFVKTAYENRKCNGLCSAALKKMLLYFTERESGAEGPWEYRAAHFEAMYNTSKGFTCWGARALPAMAHEGKAANFFGRKQEDVQENKITNLFVKKQGEGGSTDTEVVTPEKRSRDPDFHRGSGDEPSAKSVKQTQFTILKGSALTMEQIALIDANRESASKRLAARQAYLERQPGMLAKIEENRQAALLRRAAQEKNAES